MNDMEDVPLYNSKILKNYMEYLQKHYPEMDLGTIFDYAGITSYQLEDNAHWFTQRQTDRFQEILKIKIPDVNIPREVGRQFTKAKTSDTISQYALGFITPAFAYSMLEKLQFLVTKACTIQTRSIGSGKVEVIVKPKPGIQEKPYQCENRIGTYESIAALFTDKLANIEHPTCLHRGGDNCRYIIGWENTPSFTWKRIRNYSLFTGIGICSVLAFLLPVVPLSMVVLLYAIVIAAFSLYSKHLHVKELETNLKNQGETAKSLIAETNIRYNNAMLIQEIGQAISVMVDTGALLKSVMESLQKRLEFDRGMIMLANREKSRLLYAAGYGDLEDEKYLNGIAFHLDNPNSKGPIIEAYRRQIPVLVNNFKKIENELSMQSRSFVDRIGTHEFICIPIIFEGESLGVLSVDNIHTKRNLSQTDINILMGIAPQIAISLNNARSYKIIRDSEGKYRSLTENAPDIIYTLDKEGRIFYVNPAWEKILGYRLDETIGKYFVHFGKREDIKKYRQLFDRIREHGDTVKEHIGTLMHKDGSERFFIMSGTPHLNPEGGFSGLTGVFKDITDRKELESQFFEAQKMEAVGTLAGGIAHDFNNLLMGIQGFASLMLLDIDENHAHYEKLQRIEELVESGADLTKQLLGFARGGRYEVKVTDLNEVIEKTSNMFGRTHKEIRIYRKCEVDLWTVEVDRGQIEQVLLNLYVNALQAMPEGGNMSLETSNEFLSEDSANAISLNTGRYVRISVTDTGIGMDEHTQHRVFEPFFTTKEKGRGTGLGLASAYGIIKGHGGVIHVYSRLGFGTAFTIHLPAMEKDTGMCHEDIITNNSLMHSVPRGEGTILLVDDEDMIVDVCQEILQAMGYKVLIATNGKEAIELYEEKGRTIELVILDMIMPGIGVEETFDTLKKMNPDVRIMLSSGYSFNNRVQNLMEQGCRGFIQKPYNIGNLSTKIKEVMTATH